MGFTVEDLLRTEEGGTMKIVCGEQGLNNEIKGVTIIEAPDIVKSCSVEEFKSYIYEFRKKKISGLIVKRGRLVDDADKKIELLQEYARKNRIPIMEVPFEMSFQRILAIVMEHLFDEEVMLLKYFKTTHDNFTALTLGNS